MFLSYPILVYSIMGLYTHSYGMCIKVYMAIKGQEFSSNEEPMVTNYAYYTCKYYNSDISIIVHYIDWHTLDRIEYRTLNAHPKFLPIILKFSATKFL